MSRREIDFPERHAALRDEVSELGARVGEMLVEQCGQELFDRVEAARRAAIRRREGADSDIAGLCSGLDAETARLLARGFAAWFRVVNLAEQVHRIRRRRDWQASETRPQPDSLVDVREGLERDGWNGADLRRRLGGIWMGLVFTAHPTEATRRSILEREQAIARLLVERLDSSLPPAERQRIADRIRTEMTVAWQTEEQPGVRPSVADEAEHVLFYLTEVLYRVTPIFHERMAEGLGRVFGEHARGAELPGMLRFGSWVGGDMDGNPRVGADTVLETLTEHRRLVIARYRREGSRELHAEAALDSGRSDLDAAWVVSGGKEVHRVELAGREWGCDCYDFQGQMELMGKGCCKHVYAALRTLGYSSMADYIKPEPQAA